MIVLNKNYKKMKHWNWIADIGFAIVVVVIVTSCSGNKKKNEQALHHVRDTIYIENMAFNPAELTINEWDTIVWINKDIVAHDVTVLPDKTWTSDTLHPGESWANTIEVSTDYNCSIHPTMTGKVIVKDLDGD